MKRTTIFLAVILALMVLLISAVIAASQGKAQQTVSLMVTDKPAPIETAESAAADGDQAEAEQEPEYEETYNEPVYYSSVWYESDDESAEADAKEWIAQRESGGDYNARNGQYIGRYQLSADKLDGDFSEENQEATAEAYVADRYGSWQAAKDFWQQNGWY